MKPQEKAKELINKYGDVKIFIDMEPRHIECKIKETDIDTIKQCALIFLDEMIEEVREYCDDNFHQERLIYWEQVKEEINKLDNL